MESQEVLQARQLIDRSKQALIVLPHQPSTDAVASGLALYLALEQAQKKVKIVCDEFNLPPSHAFLPKSKMIEASLPLLKKFIISVDMRKTKAEQLSYEMHNDRLDVFITPKGGMFTEADVTTSAGGYEYDLIVTIDAHTLDSLGRLYDNNRDFFYATPIINIDHHTDNEYFGQINLVELKATSVSEMVFELIRDWKGMQFDEHIATSLLAGIISKTKSFKTSTVTPKSLSVASHLVASGARRDDIIRHLYQNKSISTLKLWGRALARVKETMNKRLIWSAVSMDDFEQSGGTTDDLSGVVDELMVNTPEAELIVLLYPNGENKTSAIIASDRAIDVLEAFQQFHPNGSSSYATVTFASDMSSSEAELVERARTVLQAA